MRLAKRENNKIEILDKIETFENLHNAHLIMLERGDKKTLNFDKVNFAFGIKNLVSVKSLINAIDAKAAKEASKINKVKGNWCCVCCEVWTTNANGICNQCDTMHVKTA